MIIATILNSNNFILLSLEQYKTLQHYILA